MPGAWGQVIDAGGEGDASSARHDVMNGAAGIEGAVHCGVILRFAGVLTGEPHCHR